VGALGEAATEEIAASGRRADIDALVERVKQNHTRLTVIHGPSGVGKSSLIQAGLVPALRKVIHQSRSVVPVVIEQYENWQAELAQKLQATFPTRQFEKSHSSLHSPPSPPILGGSDPQSSSTLEGSNPQSPPELGDLGGQRNISATPQLLTHLHQNDRRNLITVLIFDQFEEFFFKHPDVPGRRQFYDFLRETLNVPYVWVFLSLREDYVHYLLECDRLANITLINNDILNKNVRYYLGNFSQERSKAVIRELTEKSPYRLEEGLIDRWVADLAVELGEVRPIELQVVGAQMVQGEEKVLTLAAYEALGERPKQALVVRWLTEVVRDCGEENEELAQRVLFALTEEPEKRPVKTKTELERDVNLLTPALSTEQQEQAIRGDLDYVLTVLIGAGLAFELPASPEVSYQLIHDYLVPPIRQQFGAKLTQQLAEEREKRKLAEQNVKKRNQWLLQGSVVAAGIFSVLGITALVFSLQANEQRAEALRQKAEAVRQKDRAEAQTKIANAKTLSAQNAQKDADQQRTLANEKKLEADKQKRLAEQKRVEAEQQKNLAEQQRIEADQQKQLSVIARNDEKAQRGIAERQKSIAQRQVEIARSAETRAKELAKNNELDALNRQTVADSLILKGLMDDNVFNLEAQVTSLEKSKEWQGKLSTLHGDNRLELLANLQRTVSVPKEKNRFEDSQAEVTSVVFAPNGQSILTASADNTVKLLSLEGRLLQTFAGHQAKVTSVAFAPNGQSILTGSADNTAKLWNLEGRLLQTFTGHQDYVDSVAFAPDGQRILTGSGDKTAKLWSLEGRLLQTFTGPQAEVTSVAFAPDGQSILTGSADGTAKLWSLEGRLLQTFTGHQASVTNVAFAPNGRSLLTGSGDKTAKLWSLEGRLLQTFIGHQDYIDSVAFAPDGQSILTGSGDKTAKLWNLEGRLLQTFIGHQDYVDSVAFAPDGQSFLTGSGDKTVKLWSLKGRLFQIFAGHQTPVTNVAFAPDGQSILTGSADGTAKLWSLKGSLLQTFTGHQASVTSVAFAPDGQSILTGSADGTAKSWSLKGSLLQTFAEHQASVTSVAFAPDGQSILTGSADGTAKLWSLKGSLLQTFAEHQASVTSVAFAPDGQSILTGSVDKTAKLWAVTGVSFQTFTGHQASVTSVAFAPDGQSILTGSGDKTAKLWSLEGSLLQTFTGHQASATSVAFAPDGQSILTGSTDGTAKLWSLEGRLLQTFAEQQTPVTSVVFAPDGQSILTGNEDKTAKLWDLHLDRYLSVTCDHLHGFVQGRNNPNLPEDSRQLREPARRACEGIPLPNPQSSQKSSSKSPRIGRFRGPMQYVSSQPQPNPNFLEQIFTAIGVLFTKDG
jgi:WD40 repeat protein